MTRAALLLLASLALATPALAAPATAEPDAARVALARDLLKVQDTAGTMEKLYRDLAPAMSLSVVGALSNTAEGREFLALVEGRSEDAKTKLMQFVAEEFLAAMTQRIPELLDRIAVDYATRFTAKELQDALAFFASPSGKRFIELQPQLQERGRQIGMELGGDAGRAAMEAALKRIDANDKPAPAHPGT